MPFKKKEEAPKPPVVSVQAPIVVPDGPICECGKPVAPGQTYVCRDHIRSN